MKFIILYVFVTLLYYVPHCTKCIDCCILTLRINVFTLPDHSSSLTKRRFMTAVQHCTAKGHLTLYLSKNTMCVYRMTKMFFTSEEC